MVHYRGAMETPQHGIGPKKYGNLPKMYFFFRRFLFFQKLTEIPQIQFLEEFPVFFDPFPRFLDRIPVYQGLILLRDFPIFLRDFPIFLIRFLIFGSVSGFQKKFKILAQFVDRFPLFLGPFPLFLGPFPIFRKSFKFSVRWSVSTFFGSVFGFQKKF